MSRTTTTTITDWSSNGNDEDCSDERDGDKGAQQQPPSPLSPRNPQTDAIDEQGGQLRAPQWQESLPPVVFLDQNQYLERRQELALMMNAIRAEEEVLERRKLVQDALMAQMRAAYSNPHRTPLDADK
ncbi:hypothetical protein BG015_004279 [Linnemannia schmuckeri]|uniref:Uncharacterized protein n=1 Tax=Linnemannia schmuckeri TaxID=64567 RepID=A0A9P5RFF3_9FUNG|nr:hypothetical protein BG015_004279 [Linnemannia schmuckeri]